MYIPNFTVHHLGAWTNSAPCIRTVQDSCSLTMMWNLPAYGYLMQRCGSCCLSITSCFMLLQIILKTQCIFTASVSNGKYDDPNYLYQLHISCTYNTQSIINILLPIVKTSTRLLTTIVWKITCSLYLS